MNKLKYCWMNLTSALLCLLSTTLQIINICAGKNVIVCSIFAVILIALAVFNLVIFIKDARWVRRYNKNIDVMNKLNKMKDMSQ